MVHGPHVTTLGVTASRWSAQRGEHRLNAARVYPQGSCIAAKSHQYTCKNKKKQEYVAVVRIDAALDLKNTLTREEMARIFVE